MKPVTVTDKSFEELVLKSDKTVIVDFWAPWCGPCKVIGPVLDQVAEESADTITIAKINVDENMDTPAKYGVRGIPTLMMFANGTVTATKIGSLTASQLNEWIAQNT